MIQQKLFETEKAEASALLCADAGAEFSPCRKYRYALWRVWDTSLHKIMFIGLNPSTASENQNDPTIRRVIKMATDWGYGGVYMMNCFPLVSPYPGDLKAFLDTPFHDVEELENERWMKKIHLKCRTTVFAWGNFKIVKEAGKDEWLKEMFPDAYALVINKNGSPRHPLYVPASVKPILYKSGICA